MKLASFVAEGRGTYGLVLCNERLIDLGARVGSHHRNLRKLIKSGELDAVEKRYGHGAADYLFSEVRFLPPIPRPFNIVSSGGNFPGHIKEMIDSGLSKGVPQVPGFHIKTSGSLVGHLNPLVKPKSSTEFDYEVEFAIILGKPCRNVSPEDAMNYVLGYSGFNDGSVRDYQLKQSVSAGKNFDRSSSFGPWITTADEVGDVSEIFVTTRLNGEIVQREQIGTLQFPIHQLISYYSSIIHLQPGDVVTTGTCGGVGFFRKPQLFMKAGDRLELEIDRIGLMQHDIVDEI